MNKKLSMAFVVAVMATVIGVQADSFVGTVDTDWSNGSNWDTGPNPPVPGTSVDDTYVRANAVFEAADGPLTMTGAFSIGIGSAGSLDLNSGTINLQGGASWDGVSVGQGKIGVLNINGGNFIQLNDRGFNIGNSTWGRGTINLNSGSLEVVTANFMIGKAGETDPAFHVGYLNINGGTATFANAPTINNGTIDFSLESTGRLTITGEDQAYYEALYVAGDLTRGGTQTGTFATDFTVDGNTLTRYKPPSGTVICIN